MQTIDGTVTHALPGAMHMCNVALVGIRQRIVSPLIECGELDRQCVQVLYIYVRTRSRYCIYVLYVVLEA